MAKDGTPAVDSFWRGMFRAHVYKRSQGRLTRQITFSILTCVIALGAYSLKEFLNVKASTGLIIAGGVLAVGAWLTFRLVNLPRFADFLIQVEGEMAKVSWPSRSVLIRSAIVVIVTMFGLAFVLFAIDFIWNFLLTFLGVLRK